MKHLAAKPRSARAEKRVAADCCADAMHKVIRAKFEKVPEHRPGEVDVILADALMTGFAVFSLKDPTLAAFDRRRRVEHNLGTVYGIGTILCDSQLRERLDGVEPKSLRAAFNALLRMLERNGILEQYEFMNGCLLMAMDGTGTFSSCCLHSEECLVKEDKATGKKTYYRQMLQAAFIMPGGKAVIPLPPEMIIKQDGQAKNDCERNAARRFLEWFRSEYPELKVIVTEDALSPNAPHLRDLKRLHCSYILGVKPGDHTFLFDYIEAARREKLTTEFEMADPDEPEVIHRFSYLNKIPINASNLDVEVNFIEYWESGPSGTKHFSWVTDIWIKKKNAHAIMRGGRARWKIENETFNTLKNQDYHLGHNYGLGKKHLSTVFSVLMVLAFLVDQIQQLCCPLFQATLKKIGPKRALWEAMREVFRRFRLDSMEMLYRALLHGIKFQRPEILNDTS